MTVRDKLRKTTVITSIPGTPGTPGNPGQPHIPAHYSTETRTVNVYVPVYATGGTGSSGTEAEAEGTRVGSIVGYRTETRTETVLVYHPEQPYVPPTDPVPSTPAKTISDYQIGWNAGARSADLYHGDLAYEFAVLTSALGVVTGLSVPESDVSAGYAEIDYALHFDQGYCRVIEKGTPKTGLAGFADGDTFQIVRTGQTIDYRKNDTSFYTSDILSTAEWMLVDASLFSGGDTIYDAAVTETRAGFGDMVIMPLESSGSAGGAAEGLARMQPLEASGSAVAHGNAAVLLRALESLGRRNGYAEARPELSALTAEGSGGFMISTYSEGTVVLPYLLAGGTGLTGGVGTGAATLKALSSLGADHAYGEARTTLEAPESVGYVFSVPEGVIHATFPPFTARAVTSDHEAYARASFPAFRVGDVLLGTDARATWPPFTAAATVSNAIEPVTARASFPPFRTAFIRARASFPPFSAAAQASTVETLTKIAWVMNLALGETTRFTGFDFLNVIRLGNTLYGVKSDGLYAIGAAKDGTTNIAATVETHPTDFGSFNEKRVPHAYVGTTAAVRVTPIADGTTVGTYATDHSRARTQRAKLPRGGKGRYWAFRLANVNGGAFKVETFELEVIPLGGKI